MSHNNKTGSTWIPPYNMWKELLSPTNNTCVCSMCKIWCDLSDNSVQSQNKINHQIQWKIVLHSFTYDVRSLHHPFLLTSWCAVQSYRPHLEEWDPIWGDDWLHSPFIRWSPSWGFLGFSSVVRQMPGDLCTVPRIISLSPLSLATDATLGAGGLWLGTLTGAGGTATLTESFVLAAAHGSMDNRSKGMVW